MSQVLEVISLPIRLWIHDITSGVVAVVVSVTLNTSRDVAPMIE